MDSGGLQAGSTVPDVVTKWLPVVASAAREVARPDGAASDVEGGALTLAASVESEDQAGDVILSSGWELGAYRSNPVVLWAHQHLSPPIGRSLRTWVDGRRLLTTVEFAPTPFAQEVRRLYVGGFMRGVSVGFRALEVEPRVAGRGRRGLVFKRQELLEISAAPVRLHPEALAATGEQGHGERSVKRLASEIAVLLNEARASPADVDDEVATTGMQELWQAVKDLAGAGVKEM